MIGCALFDLDYTLVDSRPLESLRDTGHWGLVFERLNETSLIAPVSDVLRLLKAIGIPCGIITSSPREYASRLLELHRVPYDVLVADEDTTERKPHPEPILRALSLLADVDRESAFYIGDTVEDMRCAQAAGVRPLLWANDPHGLPRDLGDAPLSVVSSHEELIRTLDLVEPSRACRSPASRAAICVALPAKARAYLSDLQAFERLRSLTLGTLPPSVDIHVIGGAIRDALMHSTHGITRVPNDLDALVSGAFDGCESASSISRLFSGSATITSTPYDAVRLVDYDVPIEMWCLENSFQVRLFQCKATVPEFLRYVTFSVNAVALDMRTLCVYASPGFLQSVADKVVTLNTPRIYLPPLQIVRLALLTEDGLFQPSHTCKLRVYSLHRPQYMNFYRRHLQYKGSETIWSRMAAECEHATRLDKGPGDAEGGR